MNNERLPFYEDPWRGGQVEAASAIWDWHLALRDLAVSDRAGEIDFLAEAAVVRDGGMTNIVDARLAERVLRATTMFGLNHEEFSSQLRGAARLAGPLRFVDTDDQRAFFDAWICPVGRLLASLAGVAGALHLDNVNALSNGFYLLSRVLELPEDVKSGRLFIPEQEMFSFGVSERQLLNGVPDDRVRKMLWKQCVRIRDYFARALPLSRDLPGRLSRGFRRWWFGGLEMVNAIERRKYDVWSAPIRLPLYYRVQVRFQALFSKAPRRFK